LDPSWSRVVDIVDAGGVRQSFHLLDTWAHRDGAAVPSLTLLCVHGNPTWSYLWRGLLAAAPASWRVVAPDHLGMGYSGQTAAPRTLVERVDDLTRLCDVIGISSADDTAGGGPVVTVAHDWGGIISLGWGQQHRSQLRGVVLTNTAVHQPEHFRGPVLIRLAHWRRLNSLLCFWTPLFVRTTTSLTWPRLARPIRDAFAAPYKTVGRRWAVAQFVRDVPFAEGHPSHLASVGIADAIPAMDVPALLLWGPRDPVFGELYLRDVQARLPRSVLHRFEKASHLLPEDAPSYAEAVIDWAGGLGTDTSSAPSAVIDSALRPGPSPLAELERRAQDHTVAVAEVGGASITWAQLSARVRNIGAGMAAIGIGPGVRVALLVPPSIELTVSLYAVWRAGAAIVVADKGLGLAAMGRALRSSKIDFLIADTAGLLAAGPMRLPGTRIAVKDLSKRSMALTKIGHSLPGLARAGAHLPTPADAAGAHESAVLFTSGATGPAKGVLYRRQQVRAQLEVVRSTYQLTGQDRLVAAFAPFALFGPALGLPSAVPDVDVTRPSALTAIALAEAAITVGATVVFASPAALRNVLATAHQITQPHRIALERIRLVASFGAPIPAHLLHRLAELLPAASLHTPYGMTEAFPLTDISLAQIDAAGLGDGVCVGQPLAGVQISIAPLEHSGAAAAEFTDEPGVSGEVWAKAAHIRDRYDALHLLNQAAAAHPGWHRTGDVGFLDSSGRLWIQGRMEHVILTADGPVTPVGIEQRVEAALKIAQPLQDRAVAVVGVGPPGTAQVVVVVTGGSGALAPAALTAAVRSAAGAPLAAVLTKAALPLDIRHNSKIDRTAVAAWAGKILAGR